MLPQELIDKIALHLPLEDCCKISNYATINRIKNIEKDIVWNDAALLGSLEILKWLHKNKIKGASIRTLECAIRGYHLTACKWLYKEVGIEPMVSCYDHAGDIQMLEWLKECGVKPDYKTIYNTVESGNLNIVKWLYENNCERNEDVISIAAELGYLEIVEFIHKNETLDIRIYQDALEYAAEGGYLDVVKYLVNNIDGLDAKRAIWYAENHSTEEHRDIVDFLYKFGTSQKK